MTSMPIKHSHIQRTSPANRKLRPSRRGYALVICLLAIAVTSVIVVAIFNVQRVHVAEASARRQLAVFDSLQQAAREHAVAVLIDQPAFRGSGGPFSNSAYPDRSYQFQITDTGSGIQISAVVRADGQQSSSSTVLTQAAINARRAALGL